MIGCLLLSYKLPFFSVLFKVYHVWNFWQNVWEMCGTSIIEKYIYIYIYIYWSYKWANIHVKGRYVYKCHYSYFFYKSASFFWETKIWNVDEWKSTKQVQSWDSGSQIWPLCWRWGRPKLCFWMCQLFKKIEWVLLLPIVWVFWKEKKSTGFHGLIIYGVSMVIPNFQYLWIKPQSNLEFPKQSQPPGQQFQRPTTNLPNLWQEKWPDNTRLLLYNVLFLWRQISTFEACSYGCKFLSISREYLLAYWTQVHLTTSHPIFLLCLYSSNQLMELRRSLWEMARSFLLLMRQWWVSYSLLVSLEKHT